MLEFFNITFAKKDRNFLLEIVKFGQISQNGWMVWKSNHLKSDIKKINFTLFWMG